MAYASITKPGLHFNTKLYTGNGGTNAITGVGFQPDWVWLKKRNSSAHHQLFDVVRGVTKRIYSSNNSAESTDAQTLTAFGTDGFTLGTNSYINGNSDTFVSWNWKGGGAGSSNSDGDITSTVSANTTAGFSIVKWTADGGNASGVGHGLSTTPKVIIYKSLGTGAWYVWLNQIIDSSQDYMLLNATDSKSDIAGTYGTPSSTTISNFGFTNGANLIGYCFEEKKGFSKFGRYTGNNNTDGTFVYTGFKPALVIVKRSDGSNDWCIYDNKRDVDNPVEDKLQANQTSAESNDLSMDLLSNGFKFRQNGGNFNGSYAYIYMAFAEEPLVANVGASIPATAR